MGYNDIIGYIASSRINDLISNYFLADGVSFFVIVYKKIMM